jgi:hypothetical protein
MGPACGRVPVNAHDIFAATFATGTQQTLKHVIAESMTGKMKTKQQDLVIVCQSLGKETFAQGRARIHTSEACCGIPYVLQRYYYGGTRL